MKQATALLTRWLSCLCASPVPTTGSPRHPAPTIARNIPKRVLSSARASCIISRSCGFAFFRNSALGCSGRSSINSYKVSVPTARAVRAAGAFFYRSGPFHYRSTEKEEGVKSKRVFLIGVLAAVLFSLFLTTATFGCPAEDGNTCGTTQLYDPAPIPTQPAIQAPIPIEPGVQVPVPPKPVTTNHIKPLGQSQTILKKNLLQFANRTKAAAAPPQVSNEESTITVVPQDTWIYIGPHTTVWFRVGETLRRLSVSVDAHHMQGMQMSVYSPELQDVLNSDPTGRGTAESGHDLWWSGVSRGKGPWYVKVRNDNDISIPYNLTTSTVTDSGVEYRPDVTYAFGTGDGAKTVKVVNSKPAAPPAQPAAASVPQPPKPGSADPYNAPMPSGTWFYVEPHTSVWYAISDRGRRLNVWMDADRNSGLVMAVYGADVQDVWSRHPTGQGAPGGGHAYFWTGRSRFKGTWKIRITNPSDVSVPYNLAAANISDKIGDLCRDCHGGSIDDAEFGRCEHSGSFCDDLRDQFGNKDQ